MNLSDPIGDMLTRIRNAGKAKLPVSTMPYSELKAGLAEVLRRAGYIDSWRKEGEVAHKELILVLKYKGRTREFVIEGLKRVSKPSRRVYVTSRDVPSVLGGFGIAVLSTSSGLMTGREARKKNVGGEVLCYVW
ncbi:MAG: 30S ribosomal protein S8 [Lentisphaerae bacterium RIFOXYB12_FULL_65_16]|nr:MAG: 30S ribosomal protein S8 [Lentisphaerae bacterium RIFOXYA12_64_32]OGV90150.1 MAG: 30S ribosomal protein S8 [Lentisphaerae bacterium RIFOXYB12_FULL_65_16]